MAVTLSSDPTIVSGKLFLLAQRCGNICPVWIGNNRIAVAQALLAAHPDCNLLISIDGLQYPRLERDLEIVVIDFNEQSFGNGLMLPAGPLRDNLKRLQKVDVIVVNGKQRQHIDSNAKILNMKLVSDSFYNLLNPDSRCAPASLNDKKVHAVTSIDNSQWFFDYLQQVKLTVEFHTFSEHHRFVKKDLQYPETEAILMPEEDAVQCLAFADEKIWVLPVEAWVSGELRELILKNLRERFMDKKFLDILVCPVCKGPLQYRKAENELICKSDHLAFPIRDGIPVMLEDEARKLSPDEIL